MILDCCFSGSVGDLFFKSGGEDVVRQALGGQGVFVLASSGAFELSAEAEGEEHSVFTAPVIDALRSGSADHNRDGWIDADELFVHAESEVAKRRSQTPKRWVLGAAGTLRIARTGRDAEGASGPSGGDRRSALLERAGADALDDQVLCQALAFLRGAGAPADAVTADELIDRLARGELSTREFVERWREARPAPSEPGGRLRILTLDGGGVRVLIPAVVLAELERRSGRRVSELFDLVAASSFSALLALALIAPARTNSNEPLTASEAMARLESELPGVFDRSLWTRIRSAEGVIGPRYDPDQRAQMIHRLFDEVSLRDCMTPIVIPAYELERRSLFFFRSALARSDPAQDFQVDAVAIAATALPAFFPPAHIVHGDSEYALVDAAPLLNNPALAAYAEAIRLQPGADILLLSLGAGQEARPISYKSAADWGPAQWLSPLHSLAGQGGADAADNQLSVLLPSLDGGGHGYLRLQPALTRANDAIDDASKDNLAALRATGEELIADNQATLDQLSELLL